MREDEISANLVMSALTSVDTSSVHGFDNPFAPYFHVHTGIVQQEATARVHMEIRGELIRSEELV